MPGRYIYEDYLTDERVNLLDVQSERFYFRLFLVVDDYGRLEANEKQLKSKVFPLKDDVRVTDMTRWLTACEKAGLIELKKSSDKWLLTIKSFSQIQ